MADKPPAPGTAEGARRRKRPTPTIDLTATEVKSAATQQAPPNEPPRADETSQGGDTPSGSTIHTGHAAARNEQSARNAGFSWPLAVSGLVGGVVVAVLLFALWLADALPSRNDDTNALQARIALLEAQLRNRPAATDRKALDDLAQRVAKIETAVSKLPANDPSIPERLAAIENVTKSLGIALTALTRRGDDAANNAAAARERTAAAANAVEKLQAAVQSASSGSASGEIDALNKRIAALEQSVKATANSDNAARLALSATSLRDAVAGGEPFAAQLAEVKTLGGDANRLAVLEPFAASGLPKEAALAHALSAAIPAMLKASGAKATSGGFFARLQANAGNLVRVRPVGAPSGDDPADVLARIEVEAARADVAGAIADIAKLPPAVRAPAEAWLKKAQARQAAVNAARKFAADTARALGK